MLMSYKFIPSEVRVNYAHAIIKSSDSLTTIEKLVSPGPLTQLLLDLSAISVYLAEMGAN